MNGDETWGRADDVIWTSSAEGDLLLLADGSELPVHVTASGRILWDELSVPRTLAEVAAVVDPTRPGEDVVLELAPVLESLAALGLCRRYSPDGDEGPTWGRL